MTDKISADQLKSIIERIERLTEEKAALRADIKAVYDEAKSNGFDVKVLRAVIRLRAMPKGEREEMEAVMDVYRDALGME